MWKIRHESDEHDLKESEPPTQKPNEMTEREIECLQEHLQIIENSMTAIKTMLRRTTNRRGHGIAGPLSEEEIREIRYRNILRRKHNLKS